jgi:hypothetical protein
LNVPSLPQDGPLRTLAIAGTLAILGFLAVAVLEASARRFVAAAWAAAPLVLAAITVLLGRRSGALHIAFAIVTLGVTFASLKRLRPVLRAVEVAAALSWIVALFAARALFQR